MKKGNIFITGAPGTGKTALAHEFPRRKFYSFDLDEVPGLCFWKNRATGLAASDYLPEINFLETHDWYCDLGLLKKLLPQSSPAIVTGVVSNNFEILHLFDKVFLLQCKEETMLKRLESRHAEGGNEFGKHPAERQYTLSWYKKFEKELLEKGAISINSEASISEVADSILARVDL